MVDRRACKRLSSLAGSGGLDQLRIELGIEPAGACDDDSWPAAGGDDADSCVVAACVAGAWGVRSVDVRGLNPAVIIVGFFLHAIIAGAGAEACDRSCPSGIVLA
jgi:hypothetical protein